MPVGKPTSTTARYGCTITTVDPTQDLIEFVMKGDASNRYASIPSTDVAFRWPQVGEGWMVEQINNSWYLVGPQPVVSGSDTYRAVDPGDVVLNSPTGAVHIRGSVDSATDFDIDASGVHATPAWIALPLNTSYSNQASWRPAQYTVENGFVTLRGVIKRSGSWVSGETIATLPTGFRPTAAEAFTSQAVDSGSGPFTARLEIHSTGALVLTLVTPSIGSPATLTMLSLSGVRYQAN